METAKEAYERLQKEMAEEGGLPWPVLYSHKHGILRAKVYYAKKSGEVLFGSMSQKTNSPFNGAAWIPMDDEKREEQGFRDMEVVWQRVKFNIVLEGEVLRFYVDEADFLQKMEGTFQIHSKAQLME